MKKISQIVLVYFLILLNYCIAGEFSVPHIAENSWKTTITIINPTNFNQNFKFTKYNDLGEIEKEFTKTCESMNQILLNNSDFGYYGTAKITTDFNNKVLVKLTYQFEDSKSLSEFFIDESILNTKWVLPNPSYSQFSWFGIAFTSISDQSFTIKGYKNTVEVGNINITLLPNTKYVKLSSDIWEGIDYNDVDMVVIESQLPFNAPVSITGNETQDRHIFFKGTAPTLSKNTLFSIPHTAEETWSTSLNLYNTEINEKSVLLNSFTENGQDFTKDNEITTPSLGITTVNAGNDQPLPYLGSGTITSSDLGSMVLSYRYGNSDSICSFFLNSKTGVKWILPNSVHNWFNWFGIALNNPYSYEITCTLDAYKDGVMVGTSNIKVPTHGKFVNLSNNIWGDGNSLSYSDIDIVVVYTDVPTFAPLSITGNDSQDRHVFFSGQNIKPGANTYFVDKNFNGETSTGSALLPFKTIQDAINVAISGDLVKISTNTYNENVEINNKMIGVLGGFPGGSISDYQNEIGGDFSKPTNNSYSILVSPSSANSTIKLINSGTSGTILENLDISNGRHGVIFDDEVTWPLLNNIEILNCYIHENGVSESTEDYYGGGINVSGDNHLILGNTISSNQSGRGAGVGGSVENITFSYNTVENNTANSDHGGGIFFVGLNNNIEHNLFKGNAVGESIGYGWGGGIFVSGSANLNWNQTIGNTAESKGGGIFIDEGCIATLEHEIICKNNTVDEWTGGGAGIYVDGTGDNVGSTASISSCTIAYNSSPGTNGGNGIFIERGSSVEVENSIFYGNTDDFYIDETSSLNVNFSLSQEHIQGMGNTSGDPLFYDYENNDYHLKSTAGRYDTITKVFIEDSISSHCIDRGNLESDFSNETSENGKRINIGVFGNSEESSKTPVKSDEDKMIDNAFRIDIQNIDVTFDVYPNSSNINASATMTFYMRHGYTKPVFHFKPLTSGWTVTSINLDDQILDENNESDIKIITFDGSTQKAVEIQRDLEENKLYTLKITYPSNYMMDFYKKIWTWANVNDITGVGNEYYFPTINFPNELAKHKITFNVHGGDYSFISSGKTTTNSIEDGQQFIIEPTRDVASYTIMFVLIPSDDVLVSQKVVNGVNVTVMAYDGGASIPTAFNYLENWLPQLENDLGEFPMPEGLSVFLLPSGGGMEFYGGTITSLSALNHEVFHMYYGCSTINKTYRDSWLDEAINEWYEFHHSPITSTYISNIVSGRTPIGVGFDTRAYNQGAKIIGAVAEELGGVNEMVVFLDYLHNNYFYRPYTTLEFVEIIKLFGNVDMYDNFIQWVFYNESQSKSEIQQGIDPRHQVDMTPPEKIRKKYLQRR